MRAGAWASATTTAPRAGTGEHAQVTLAAVTVGCGPLRDAGVEGLEPGLAVLGRLCGLQRQLLPLSHSKDEKQLSHLPDCCCQLG
eukprot:1975545-Rhodomonas_salina.1